MTALSVTPVLRRSSVLVALAIAAMAATTAHADSIVYQSNLSVLSTPSPNPNGRNFQLGYNGGNVTGITNTSPGGILGFNFVYAQGTPSGAAVATSANLTGASSNAGGAAIKLAPITADPFDTQDLGAFLALDSQYQTAAITINISTVAGQVYTVGFDWAATQQTLGLGQTSDFLTVGFGGAPTQNTGTLTIPQQGFSGWKQVTDTFTAVTTGTSVLSFLATGSSVLPGQQPAMVLLDNITVTQKTTTITPEPGSLVLLSTGLIGLGSFVRARYKS